jgi:tetratricopeptide (TPR) repeat protein
MSRIGRCCSPAHAEWALALIGGDDLEGSGGESSRPGTPEIIDGLTRFVTGLAVEQPLVLVIDDVRWADAPSLHWMMHLAARLVTVPILVVVANRTGESEGAKVLARLTAAAHFSLSPVPLSQRATSAIVAARLQRPVDRATQEAIHQVTRGNPFLLDQLVRHLGAGSLTPELVRAARPERLHSLIWSRLLRLGEDARALAEAVVVLGVNTPLRRAAALAGLSRSLATRAAERLSAEAIFEDALPLNFIHPLVRNVLADGLTAARADELRRAAASVLLADGADAETAAVQLLSTEPVDEDWAADLLVRAGHRANARGAHESAARFFLRALSEGSLAEDARRELRVAQGRALIAGGRREGTSVLRGALTNTPDPVDRARLALELGDALVTLGQAAQAVDVYETGAVNAAGCDERLRLHILGRRALALLAGPGGEAAMRAVVEVRGAARAAGGTAERGALALLATVTFWQGSSAKRCARQAEQALASEPYAAGRWDWTPDLSWLLAVLARSDAYEKRDAFLDEAIARAEAAHAPGDLAAFAWWRSFGNMRRGRIKAAEADARVALGPFGHRTPEVIKSSNYAAILVNPLVARGALGEAEALLDEFDGPSDVDDVNVLPMLEPRANLRLAQGRPEEALAELERLQTEADRRGIKWLGAASWPGDLAIVRHLLGDSTGARRLAEEQLDRARRFGASSAVGRALIALGTVEPGERAVATLAEAVTVLAVSPARLERARAMVALASAVRERGRHESAVSLLDQAIEEASRCGATGLRDAARRELRLAGVAARSLPCG